MKLSVIIPVYNVEKYLAACVDSLLNQTMRDLEILLVDDGSTDSSGAIADRYAAAQPDRVRVLHVDNGGQGRARNFALPLARGEYLGFVDSDDWVLPEMYEKLCRRADESGADIALSLAALGFFLDHDGVSGEETCQRLRHLIRGRERGGYRGLRFSRALCGRA